MDIIFLIKSIMNKKLFSWKALAGVALFAAMTMGLQSCTQTEAEDPTPATPAPAAPLVIDGSTITFNGFVKLSDINAVLKALAGSADATVNVTIDGKTVAVKCPKGTLKRNGNYEIVINNSTVKVSATDYTLALPECTDAIFDVTLAEKFAEVKNAITFKDEALDYVVLNLAADSYDLDIDVMATTMVVQGAASIGTLTTKANQYNVNYSYSDVSWAPVANYQSFGGRFIVLGDGLDIFTIDPQQGTVIVGGASIESLAVNGTWADHYAYGFTNGSYTYSNLKNPDGSTHFLHSITADGYVRVWSYSKAVPAENVYVKDGADVYFYSEKEEIEDAQRNHFYINNIIGLGDGTGTVWAQNRNESMSGERHSYTWSTNWYAFQDVKKMYNVTIGGNTVRLFPDVEKCTVLGYDVYFYTTTQEVKSTKFPNAGQVYFFVDARNNATAYNFSYTSCEFPADVILGVSDFETEGTLLDADGNAVVYAIWRYAEVDEDGNYTGDWLEVKGEVGKVPSVVPDKSRKEGKCYFRIVEGKEYTPKINDMTITIGLTGNKIGGTAITASSDSENLIFNLPNNVYTYGEKNGIYQYKAEMTYKFNIGGKLYRWAFDTISMDWIFVTTN